MGVYHKSGVYTSESTIGGLIKIVTRSYVLKKDAEKAGRETVNSDFKGWSRICSVQDGKVMRDGLYFWDVRDVWVKTKNVRDLLGVLKREKIQKMLEKA